MANVVEFNSHKLDSNDGTDSEEFENTDPAIVAADVAAQTVCLLTWIWDAHALEVCLSPVICRFFLGAAGVGCFV